MSEFCLVQIMAPNEEWFRVLPNANQLATDVIQRAVRESGKVNANSEVSVVFSDDRELQLLNKEYRGIDKPTNVLSFPGPEIEPEDPNSYTVRDRPHVLGDIVLSLETTEREAKEQGKELKHHVAHLLVHGALHLLRYDHENEGDAQVMEDLERAVLAGLGIGDPYVVDEDDSDAEPAPAAADSPAASADAQPVSIEQLRAKPRRKAAAKRSPKTAVAKPAAPKAKRGTAKKAPGKKAAGKRPGAKRAPARGKTSVNRRTAAAKRKAPARKPVRAAKRPVAKRAAPPKRSAAKRAAPKRTAPKRAAPNRASSKRAPSKRAASKRAAPKRATSKRATPKRASKRTARAKKR